MAYQDKNFNYIDAEAYDRRAENSVLENYVLNLWQPFLKNIVKNLSVGKIVVDWGCGTCEYSQAAVNAKKIYAIDVSEPMLKVCREKLANFGDKEIIHGSGFGKEIPAGIADLVLTIGVWEYVDPKLLFEELKRITKKGAKIIVVFPNIYSDLNWMRSLAKMRAVALRPGFIKKLFSAKGGSASGGKNDFKLLDSASFGYVFWVPKSLQFLALPIWKFFDFIWSPFQKFLPLGVNVYYLFERK
ncbi:class I SAM-dependent methyltransferase [Candidatus Azambacteria bacterium]|nr:class I SAM-dependent methyltransferase [Candidatus Azambacteria bacterium]